MVFGSIFDLRGDAGVADGEVVEIGAFVAVRIIAMTIGATLGEKSRSLGEELSGGDDLGGCRPGEGGRGCHFLDWSGDQQSAAQGNRAAKESP